MSLQTQSTCLPDDDTVRKTVEATGDTIPNGAEAGEEAEDGWGWEAFGSEDEHDNRPPQQVIVSVAADIPPEDPVDEHENSTMNENQVESVVVRKSLELQHNGASGNASHSTLESANVVYVKGNKMSPSRRGGGGSNNAIHTLKGIASSPSFNELEMAIGATIAMSSHDSFGEQLHGRSSGNASPNAMAIVYQHGFRLSSTDLTQQKLQQQRLRNQHQQRHSLVYSHGQHHSNSMLQQHHLQQRALAAADQLNQAAAQVTTTAQARVQLSPFINESESRAMIVFHSTSISPLLVRNTCSKYGVLYYIRPEFHSKGLTLISYFDLRAATTAKTRIVEDLGTDSSAHYSVMLHAANSNSEEFRLVVRDIPEGRSETDVQTICSRYGQLRSIEKSFGDGCSSDETLQSSGSTAYTVEFFNIQDARLAASELSATSAQIWGPETTVNFAPLDDRKQQLCRQLLATLSRWRTEMSNSTMSSLQQQQLGMNLINPAVAGISPSPLGSTSPITAALGLSMSMGHAFPHVIPTAGVTPTLPIAPLPLLPNNPQNSNMRFSQSVSQGAGMMPAHVAPVTGNMLFSGQSNLQFNGERYNEYEAADHEDKIYRNSNQERREIYRQHVRNQKYNGQNTDSRGGLDSHGNGKHFAMQSGSDFSTTYLDQTAAYVTPVPEFNRAMNISMQQNAHTSPIPQHHNGRHNHNYGMIQMQYSAPMQNSAGGRRAKNGRGANHANFAGNAGWNSGCAVDSEFELDLQRIEDGIESRTTVMVRNIPNKYNQTMLLDEVNVNHEGTYDFFYLPIDFKNKCNVGYCFINFMDPKSIPPFVQEFNGRRWKNFNSEKVCAVTFARIQGKQAMIARFQNSSLLEKDDEYQPLLFVSSGPDRGKPELFPTMNRFRQSGNAGASYEQNHVKAASSDQSYLQQTSVNQHTQHQQCVVPPNALIIQSDFYPSHP